MFLTGIVAGDIDGNGDSDLVLDSRAFVNDGVGNSTDISATLPLPPNWPVAVADIDGDGDNDFEDRVLIRSAGTFADLLAFDALPQMGIAPADYNGDGDVDFLVSRPAPVVGAPPVVVELALNDGLGGFPLGSVPPSRALDFDNDGDMDLVGTGARDVDRLTLAQGHRTDGAPQTRKAAWARTPARATLTASCGSY